MNKFFKNLWGLLSKCQTVSKCQPRLTEPVKLAAGVKSIWKASPRKSSTLYQLASSADNICTQFGPRSGLTKCQSWSGSKLFDTDGIPDFFVWKKLGLNNGSRRQKKDEKFPACKEIMNRFREICLSLLGDSSINFSFLISVAMTEWPEGTIRRRHWFHLISALTKYALNIISVTFIYKRSSALEEEELDGMCMQWHSQKAEKSYAHRRETTGSSNDTLQ